MCYTFRSCSYTEMDYMNILFLCTANIHRSKTAEDHFSVEFPVHDFRSAGLSKKECQRNGSTLCTTRMLQWADIVYVFEPAHIDRIREYTGEEFARKIQCLHIDDNYQYMQPELIRKLEQVHWMFSRNP